MSFFDDLGARADTARDRVGGKVAWWTIVGVVVLAAAAYVALAWYAEDTAPRRASVAGVDIGGLSSAEAAAVLRRELVPRLANPVVLAHEGEEVSVVPREAGMAIDVAETLRRAGAESARTPRELWDHYTGDRDTTPVLRVDAVAMSRVLDGVTDRFDTLAVEGTLDFSTGRAEPIYGKPGLRVDREATIALLREATFDVGVHELPVESRRPYISGTAVQEALRTFGRPAMSAPVAVLIGPARVVVPPELVGQALTMIPGSGELKPRLDVRKLLEVLEPHLTAVGEKPRNASVRVVDGRLERVPARTGAAWDDAELEQGMLDALVKPKGERRFRLQAALTEPEVDDDLAAKWGIRERVQAITVDLGAPAGEETEVAVSRLDNLRLPAGKSLAFLDTVTDEGVGDQTAVVARALFTVSYRLGLEVEEHSPPTRRDPRFPAAMDIRVDEEHDLRLRNTTPHSVLVSARLVGETLELSLWSTPHHDASIATSDPGDLVPAGTREDTSADCTPRRPLAGFSVAVARTVTAPTGEATRDRLTVRYPPREGITC